MTKRNFVNALFLGFCLLCISVEGFSRGSFNNNSKCSSRRRILKETLLCGGVLMTAGLIPQAVCPPSAAAAPELGYFPVTTNDGDVTYYVPKRVSRKSSPQAIELATILKEKGVTMYGTYWCPDCTRQKELFGVEAWSIMKYVECSPKGYGFQGPKICQDIKEYPTFKDKTGRVVNVRGERPLDFLAQQVRFSNFDPSSEEELLATGCGTACKLPNR